MKTQPKAEPAAPAPDTRKRILVVDDHPAVREGLSTVIDQTPDLSVCGEAESAAKAQAAIAKLKPDAVLIDLSLHNSNGLELIKDLRSRYSGKLPMLVLSMHDEMLYADRVLHAGALGYVMKSEPTSAVVQGLRQVLRGEVYVSDKLKTRILGSYVNHNEPKQLSPIELLSDRELEVFELIGQGLSTRQVAERLHLSMKTVSCYRENLKAKLGLDRAHELVRHAIYWVEQGGSQNPAAASSPPRA